MPLKLNPFVLARAREAVDGGRERLWRTGVMLDPRRSIVVRGMHAIHCNRYRHSAQNHHNFKHSPEWKAVREQLLSVRGTACQSCGRTSRVAVHHRYYFSGHEIWEYADEDLLVLCKMCHSIVHERTETAELFAYYEICYRQLLEVEQELEDEELEWEIDGAAGRHGDPTLSYDEDNPGYWEQDALENPDDPDDPDDPADVRVFHPWLEEGHDQEEDD